MTTRASGTFDVEGFDQEPYDDREGATLSRARLTKTFKGDVEATSSVEMLMAVAQEGSAAYVAFERIVGAVHGRSGSFVLHHSATSSGGGQSGTWTVVPDSGTGDLRGLRGEAQIVIEPDGGHTFTLDYEID